MQLTHLMTDQPTDRPTDRPTNQPTDRPTTQRNSMVQSLPWKLTAPQIITNLPKRYATGRMITVSSKTHHLSLQSEMSPVHAFLSHFFMINFNVVVSRVTRSSNWPLSFRLTQQKHICICILVLPMHTNALSS